MLVIRSHSTIYLGEVNPLMVIYADIYIYIYIIQILTAREGNMGNCNPSKTNVDRGEAEVDIGFRGVTISYVTLS